MALKKHSLKTKERRCPKCGQFFRQMTDKQWDVVLVIHLTASKKHHQYRDGQYKKLPLVWQSHRQSKKHHLNAE